MASSHELVVALVELVVVTIEVVHAHHAFAVVLVDLAIKSIGLNARDVSVELQAYLVSHELHHLIFYRLTLSVLSRLLHCTRMFAQLLVVVLVHRASTLLIAGEQSVYHGVGVTAYRRCEVSVVVESQTIVPNVVSRIFGFHHGTQGKHLHKFLLALSLHVVHKLVEILAYSTTCAARLHLIAERHKSCAQRLQFLRVGLVVNTINEGLGSFACLARLSSFACFTHLTNEFSHCAIGKQHELLNELVGILRLLVVAASGVALLVNIEVKLLTVELHGTILEACGTQFLRQSVEHYYLCRIFASIRLVLRSSRRRLASAIYNTILLKNVLHLLIGKAPVTLYHRVSQVPVLDVGLLV